MRHNAFAARSDSHEPTASCSSSGLSSTVSTGVGPLKTETVPVRFSVMPSTSDTSGAEQEVGLRSDLVRGTVVDPQRAGTAANVNAERLPGERLLEDPLAQVAGEEEAIGSVTARAARKRNWATPISCASSTTAKSNGGCLMLLRWDASRVNISALVISSAAL